VLGIPVVPGPISVGDVVTQPGQQPGSRFDDGLGTVVVPGRGTVPGRVTVPGRMTVPTRTDATLADVSASITDLSLAIIRPGMRTPVGTQPGAGNIPGQGDVSLIPNELFRLARVYYYALILARMIVLTVPQSRKPDYFSLWQHVFSPMHQEIRAKFIPRILSHGFWSSRVHQQGVLSSGGEGSALHQQGHDLAHMRWALLPDQRLLEAQKTARSGRHVEVPLSILPLTGLKRSVDKTLPYALERPQKTGIRVRFYHIQFFFLFINNLALWHCGLMVFISGVMSIIFLPRTWMDLSPIFYAKDMLPLWVQYMRHHSAPLTCTRYQRPDYRSLWKHIFGKMHRHKA
jgi:hypothetical protein